MVAIVVALQASGLAFGAWTQLDLDEDGLKTSEEWDHGTDPALRDTDGDGLDDGYEIANDLDPTSPDTDGDSLEDGWEEAQGYDPGDEDSDGDGLTDDQEGRLGADPLSSDTDNDGLDDLEESRMPDTDCNSNGIPAIAEPDDDDDGRRDADEPRRHRCDSDADDDGVLDGYERNPVCIKDRDCDDDGLPDGLESGTDFDPLNADTFDANLPDSVLWAFEEYGQEPSGDTDRDGIPDKWEQEQGLINWGPFDPESGTKDLLIEYVRVQGPDSSRFGFLDLSPAYRETADMFRRDGGLSVDWTETTVRLDQEERPPLLPSDHSAYYRNVLRQAEYSGNPYVTTVVMNPQHDQSQLLHLGVAPIRGMLAAVDYGEPTNITYDFDGTDLTFTPFFESVIEGNRLDVCYAWGFDDCGEATNGDYFLEGTTNSGYRFWIRWQPFWYDTAPRLVGEDGSTTYSTFESASVQTTQLASTIVHELGHTLGLCHLEDADCAAKLSGSDQYRRTESTMHTNSGRRTLNFLDSEWGQVDEYLTCPPQESVRLVAQQVSTDQLINAKYGYTLEEATDVDTRSCGEFPRLTRSMAPAEDLGHYEPPPEEPVPEIENSQTATTNYRLASAVAAVAAGIAAGFVSTRLEL